MTGKRRHKRLTSVLIRVNRRLGVERAVAVIHNPPHIRQSSEQEEQYRSALAQCEEDAFESGIVGRPASPDGKELAASYEAYLLTYDCLVRHGYQVDQPPSLDLYVESEGSAWHPYQSIPPSEIKDVEEVCPQDLLVLFEQLSGSESGG